MILIDIEDLKVWRANRIQGGQCSYDDMMALGKFIEEVEKIEAERGESDESVVRLLADM